MKVLLLNGADSGGGADIAAYRIYQAILSKKIDCNLLVKNKTRKDNRIIKQINKFPTRVLYKFLFKVESIILNLYKKKSNTHFTIDYLPFGSLIQTINKIDPDIVHINYINGMMHLEDFKKINKPIVWTMHDMWPFTGGCHYTEYCESFMTGCGNCKALGSNMKYDLSKFVFNRKIKTFNSIRDIRIVPVSKWLNKFITTSQLFKDHTTMVIPNTLDTKKFKSIDKNYSRKLWDLPSDKKIIIFGSISVTEKRKGFHLLSKALKLIKNTENVELVIFGNHFDTFDTSFKINYYGFLHDEESKISLYNCADVMVVPSIQEAFGQTASESLSCGLPVVAFDDTGVSDIVDHKINGYLAKPLDYEDLAFGINWILNNRNYKNLSTNARKKAIETFDYSVVSEKYLSIYKSLLSSN